MLLTNEYIPHRVDGGCVVFDRGTPQICSLYTVPGVFGNKMSRICPIAKEQKMDKQRDIPD